MGIQVVHDKDHSVTVWITDIHQIFDLRSPVEGRTVFPNAYVPDATEGFHKYRAGSRQKLHHGTAIPQRSISGTQLWIGRTKELRMPPRADAPVRHGRFAAAGGVGFVQGRHSASKTL